MLQFIRDTKKKLKDTRRKGFSLSFRVLGAFFVLLLTILLAVILMMSAFGVFNTGKSKSAALLEHELASISDRIRKDFNTVTSYSINLSEELSISLKQTLSAEGISPEDLADNPECLSNLLESALPTMTAELKALKASGVFLFLDATVNPELKNAADSRSGLYLKNITAQNNIFTSHYDLRFLYGPMNLAQQREISVLPQWKLEIDRNEFPFFDEVISVASEHPDFELNRLFFWTGKATDGASDDGTFCAVPVRINGIIVGVCGFEIGSKQFKLSYTPSIDGQDYCFCMLVPSDGSSLFFDRALFSGNYAVTSETPNSTVPLQEGTGFLTYHFKNTADCYGKQVPLSFYSSSSCFAGETFYTILLTPKEQMDALTRKTASLFLFVLSLLFLFGAGLSMLLYLKNVKPVKDALHQLRQDKKSPKKTHIPEIDDLFDFLEEKDKSFSDVVEKLQQEKEEAKRLEEEQRAMVRQTECGYDVDSIDPELYEAFVQNLKYLTEREQDIFDRYIMGKKAKEIAAELFISENTMKFHNRNIYDKLCVSSRKELVLYAMHMKAQKNNDSQTAR